MDIVNLVRPRSLDEAYEYLTEKKAVLLGGGAWSRMSPRSVEYAVDLSALDLRYIRRAGDRIEIGAMTTARDIETSPLLAEAYGPLFRRAVENIVGVQMRNIVSAGGTVAGRFGFAELNTVLLALDARLALHRAGEVDLESFLAGNEGSPALIEKILIPGAAVRGAYGSVRNTRADLPILNAAAVLSAGSWRIAVGARPGSPRPALKAAALLAGQARPDAALAEKAGLAAAEELSFGKDIRGTAEYRKSVCAVLVRRAIGEVGA